MSNCESERHSSGVSLFQSDDRTKYSRESCNQLWNMDTYRKLDRPGCGSKSERLGGNFQGGNLNPFNLDPSRMIICSRVERGRFDIGSFTTLYPNLFITSVLVSKLASLMAVGE